MDHLLSTKLHLPPTRADLVARPRLLTILKEGLGRNLTLISAPAGFGKTTLVREWIRDIRQAAGEAGGVGFQVAWFSLDESDNDPTRFLTYLIAALNQTDGAETRLGEGALSMLQAPQPPPAEAVLTSLINEIAEIPDQILLVLDDYHLIETESIHAALTFLLEHLPLKLRLVIATRIDPLLPLPRLRARDQLVELRAADLRFTQSEAAEFLNRIMGLSLSAEDIATLEKRTEGWIAGLQLAALSMQGSSDTSGFIQTFTGSHRHILDYLLEEVLEQQTDTIQSFLLQTAVLDRLTGSLCDALTGKADGRAILAHLDQTNLFIIPLDEERHWYRYHHLFADLLRKRQRETLAEQLPSLHSKASRWYEQHDFADEAITHSFKAEDFERAAQLTVERADILWERGEHAKLQDLLSRLPPESIYARPHLCLFNAWYSFIKGDQSEAEECLEAAANILEGRDAGDLPADQGLLFSQKLEIQRGRIATVRSIMDAHQGNVKGLILHAQQALDALPEEDRVWRSLAAMTLGDVYGYLGDMSAAYQARDEAYHASTATGESYYGMLAGMKLAITARAQGRLTQTIEICRQQVQVAGDIGLPHSSLNGLLLLIHAEVLNEMNETDTALQQAVQGFNLAANALDMAILGWSFMCMARILFSSQDLPGLEKLIQRTEEIGKNTSVPPWAVNQIALWNTRLLLAQNRIPAASQWAQDRGFLTDGVPTLPEAVDYFTLIDGIVLARVLMAQRRPGEALNRLAQLLQSAEAGGRVSRLIEIQNLTAQAHERNGDTDRALDSLERALALAEPEGFIRTFIDEGPPMAHLLFEALSRGITPDYVRRILAAFPVDEKAKQAASIPGIRKSNLIEPLSDRELEVLQLIAAGLTNQEIATHLYITLNTVKAHTRNIYGKLDVNRRTQAVLKAKSLGILPAD